MRADRSGPLRLGERQPVEPPKPLADLPALATIAAFIAKRPAWAASDPFPVPADLYEAAETEMRQRMKQRGFALPASGELARDGVRHFMLNGVAIVVEARANG